MAEVVSISVREQKGVPKKILTTTRAEKDHGLPGDRHAGPGDRQMSLFARECLRRLRAKGIAIDCGGFGENITTSGIKLSALKPGARLLVGEVPIEVTRIGKFCKKPCAAYPEQSLCPLPREGAFAKVLASGTISVGDRVEII
ncbi:MAG: MOSC domain-containing protein [Candidatus Omnitrophota bacterium]